MSADLVTIGSRCSGHCCREFYLPYKPLDLFIRKKGLGDGEYIAAMVLPLGPVRPSTGDSGGDGWWYTCKHHDAKTGDCAAYDDRPRMCSEYPYGRRCEYAGCTASYARDAAPQKIGLPLPDDAPIAVGVQVEGEP